MGIVDEDIARVRQATDLVALVSEHTQLRKVGSRWSGLCPFHSEKSPSFSVNQAEGLYYCFGCRVSGDAITFLRELEGLDFVEAVERLAAKAGIALNYTDRAESATRQKRKGLLAKLEEAVDFYHERLKTSPDASAARSYLRSRGFDAEEVARYRIGWAPDSWDVLCRSLRLDSETATATGLGFTNKAGRLQDFFRARVLFPIFDAEGHAVGFGGRIMPGEEGAKYKNSRDSDLYHKSRLLYGLNWARQAAVRNGRVVICEGYTDVIGFHRAGVPEAVATCGTSLTEDHLKLLSRYVDKVVLAFDADSAGQAAAERIYAWEKAFNLAVEVVRSRRPGRSGGERRADAALPLGARAGGRDRRHPRGPGPSGDDGARRGGRTPRPDGARPLPARSGRPLPARPVLAAQPAGGSQNSGGDG